MSTASVAIPAAASVVGGLLSSQGGKSQARAAGQASRNAENARKQAMQFMTPEHLSNLGNWFFPGSVGNTLRFEGATPSATPQAPPLAPAPALPGRATGGPVAAQQPYVVGEQGPEVFTPQTQGQVTPNAQTQAAPSPDTKHPYAEQQARQRAKLAVPKAAPAGANTPGNAVMAAIMNYFNNPGQMSPVAYERAQEQANIGERSAKSAATQGLTGRGIDPNSPMGMALANSAALGAGRQRNEAARDYSLAQEGLRRTDIQTGMADYFNVLQSIFGVASGQASAAGGTNFPSAAMNNNPMESAASSLADLGGQLSKYYANKPTANPVTVNASGSGGGAGGGNSGAPAGMA